ncbi:MAG: GNAT family N-acetyltransferase [Gammaproteobacteria bacterium]|nr:GNAT family N-acetyltransferase [Gammaproteobacteria bacterium]
MPIDRPPATWVATHRMRDGTAFRIFPCIDDGSGVARALWRAELQRGMQRLSPRSRWQRFASGIDSLSERQLDELTDVDGSHRVALCAALQGEQCEEGVGLARYVELADQPAVAEFAVTVIDAWQGRGIGSALLDALIDTARQNGIKVLRGFVFPSNTAMLALCRRHRAVIEPADDFLEVDLVLQGTSKNP